MHAITSRQNEHIKQIINLKNSKYRQLNRLFVVEGCREIERLLNSNYIIEAIYYCPELCNSKAIISIVECATTHNTPIYQLTLHLFEKISYKDKPDSILIIAHAQTLSLEAIPNKSNPLLIIVENIEKPGNLGAIIRTAKAVGADAVIVCNPVVDIYNPNVIKASQGLIFTLPIIQSTDVDIMQYCLDKKIELYATTPQASKNYWDCDFRKPVALIMGAESVGLSDSWLKHSNVKCIKIPILAMVDSLNVSTATALVSYEALRQRTAETICLS